MIHNYPYTDFHELNLDYLIDLCRRTMGLHLEIVGDALVMKNQAGDVISNVTIHYADTALTDVDGKAIKSYLFDAGINGRTLVFTNGAGTETVITVPYATSAEKDVNNVELTSYVHGLGVSGNKLLVTFGNGTTYAFTVPFATKASQDENGKAITSYVASITTGNDKLIVKDGDGVTLSEITVPYATKALNDVDGDAIKETYATDLTTGVTTVILRDKVGNVLSEITVPFATRASQDNNGNVLLSDYGYHLNVNGNKVGLESHAGTTLNEITVPFATKSTDAENAIESVSISGDNLTFTTYGGQTITITVPYAVKALKDSLNNTFTTSYIANAVNDTLTGKITFYAQDGSVIAEMTPTVDKAVHDSLNNTIADYIKTIVTNPNSDYVTITHGDGDVDTLTVHYSTKAWKDTYGNVIGNVYIKRLAFGIDSVTGKDVLIAYNGEDSEIFRIEVPAVVGSLNDLTDVNIINPQNGEIIYYDAINNEWTNVELVINTSQIDGFNINNPSDGDVIIYDGNTNTWVTGSVVTSLDDLSDVSITTPTISDVLKYDSINNEWVNGQLALHDLSDITEVLPIPQGAFLVYDSLNHWVASLEGINSMTDVNAPTPSNGDVLTYDGVTQKWVNDTIPTPTVPSDINDLNDVDILNPVSGDILIYDQVDNVWYNKDLLMQNIANTDINTPTDGDVLIYDGNASTWNNTNLLDIKPFISLGEYQMSTQSTSLNSLADILNSGFGDTLYLTIFDTNGVERRVPCCAYLAETENAGTWSRALFVNAVSWTKNGTAERMRAFIYFDTGSAIYKLSITAEHGDTNFTVVSMTTVTDIFS